MSILKELNTPIFYAEGQPQGVTRENYQLLVEGLVENAPLVFSFEQIEQMPFTSANTRLTSVSGWSVRADFQGVKFSDFLKFVKPQPEAEYVEFESFGKYTTCIPLTELKKDNCLICYKVNGEYLEIEYGGPVRLIVPHLWGYKSIKGLHKIIFSREYESGYWEERGYSDEAHIEPGFTLDVNTGKRRRISGGEVTEF